MYNVHVRVVYQLRKSASFLQTDFALGLKKLEMFAWTFCDAFAPVSVFVGGGGRLDD